MNLALSTQTRAAVARAADFFVANPECFTHKTLARDADGHPLNDPCSPKAVCWCSLGRIAVELGVEPTQEQAEENSDIVYDVLGDLGLNTHDIYTASDATDALGAAKYLRSLVQ